MDIKRNYGWKREPETGKILMGITAPKTGLPPLVNLVSLLPPAYDQEQTSSCTGNAISGGVKYAEVKAGQTDSINPSRLFIYYNERLLEGNTDEDSGGQIHDGIKGCNIYGVVDESIWAFDPNKVTEKPSKEAYELAVKNKITHYTAIDNSNIDNIKAALAHGYPIVFGFTVYSDFESTEVAQTGILKMPTHHETIVGGHAVLAVGYDDSKKAVLVRNSWGASWGLEGNFWMPYEYITNTGLASDFWMIRI